MNDKLVLAEKIAKELSRRFKDERVDWNAVDLVMKHNGDKIRLRAYYDDGRDIPKDFDVLKCDMLIASGPVVANLMYGDPLEVCLMLADYPGLLAEFDGRMAKLRAEAEKNAAAGTDLLHDEFELFSAAHRELLGYKPHTWVVAPCRRLGASA